MTTSGGTSEGSGVIVKIEWLLTGATAHSGKIRATMNRLDYNVLKIDATKLNAAANGRSKTIR